MISLDMLSNQQVAGFSRKPKRPKVYAIRTFPEGCGAHDCRMDLKEKISENSAVMIVNNHQLKEKHSSINGVSRKPKRPRVSAVRTFPEGCGEQECRMDLKENISENSAVMVVNCHPLEEKHSSIDGVSRKSKRPKVSAIRTFPEGCGEQEFRMDLKENITENSTVMVVNSDHLEEKNLSTVVDTINHRKSPPLYIISPTIARKSPPHPPSRILKELPSMTNNKPLEVINDFSRHKVKYALHCYQEMLSKLLQENVHDCQVVVYNGSRSRVDMMAAKFLKEKLKWINTNQRLGDIPGVQVGDVFEWMAELNVIGLHHQYFNGIDYMKKDGKTLATSIVASGRYTNIVESSDVLIYSGHGGNPCVIINQPQDQKLERGNLALKNSMEAKTPVRVIRGFKFSKSSNTSYKNTRYVYDGLYYVHDYWQERGRFDKLVFMFSLERISGQPKLAWPKQLMHV